MRFFSKVREAPSRLPVSHMRAMPAPSTPARTAPRTPATEPAGNADRDAGDERGEPAASAVMLFVAGRSHSTRYGAGLIALRETRLVRHACVGEAPDARQAGELALARRAEEDLGRDVHLLGLVVAVGARAIHEANGADASPSPPWCASTCLRCRATAEQSTRGRSCARALRALLAAASSSPALLGEDRELPRADARDLAGVLGEVLVGVDGLLRGAEHAHERAERLGVRDPLAALAERIHTEQLADAAERLLRRERADPARLVVDHRRVDARVGEDGTDLSLALLRSDAEQVGLQQRRTQLLFPALAHSALRQLGTAFHRTRGYPTALRPRRWNARARVIGAHLSTHTQRSSGPRCSDPRGRRLRLGSSRCRGRACRRASRRGRRR